MTRLKKPVSRCTEREYAVLYRKARPVVVTLLPPDDMIEFRELGRRSRWLLPIDAAFRYAVQKKTLAEVAERRAKRKAKPA